MKLKCTIKRKESPILKLVFQRNSSVNELNREGVGRVGNGVTLSQLHSQTKRRYRALLKCKEESQGQWKEVGMG